MRTELVDVFAGMALFADLPGSQLEEVAHTFEEQTFEAGERIVREGLSGGSFYVIVDGQASVARDGTAITTLARGDFFGEISILLGQPPVADIVADTELRVVVLPGPQLEDFLLTHPNVAYRMMQAQARRLRATTRWLS